MINSVSINLVGGKNKNILDKFIKWALTIGRVVVIVTEAVALGTFLYRFSLDQQLIDLHGSIKSKQEIIKFSKNTEDKYRNLQARLSAASKLSNVGKETTDLFQNILDSAPQDLIFNNIILSQDYIKIAARVQSSESLSNFIDTLKKNPEVSSISIDQIENKTSNATITVSITAMLNKK
ncbi:MAG: PilN domain-containing protein [Candidatus Levyibacteriota bacterium]